MLEKRVFIVNQEDSSSNFGVGRYISEIIVQAKEYEARINLIVVNIGKAHLRKVEIMREKNIRFLNIPRPLTSEYVVLKALTQQYSKAVYCILADIYKITKDDVFHFNSNMQYFLLDEIRRNTSAKIIYTIHVALWKVFYDNYNCFIAELNDANCNSNNKLSIKAEIRACFQSNKVICLSEEMRQKVVNAYKVPVEKVVKIVNGIYPHVNVNDHNRTIQLKKMLHVQPDEFVFLFVGRLHVQKGIMELVKSFCEFVQAERRARLLVVGSGPLQDMLFDNYKGDNNGIHFTGYVKPDQVRYYYQLANAFVLPSYHEQCSYSVLEAMKYKVPMILSDISAFGGIKDGVECVKINNKHNNKIEALKAALFEIIADSEKANYLASNAHDLFLREFNSEKMFDLTYLSSSIKTGQ